MKFKKISKWFTALLVIAILSITATLSVVSNAFSLDLVAKVAVTSFDALTKAIPDKVTFDGVKGDGLLTDLTARRELS